MLVKLGDYVELRQGLAINAQSNHLLSKNYTNEFIYPLLKIVDMVNKKFNTYISTTVNHNVIATNDDIIYTRTGQIGLAFRGFHGVVHNNSFIVSLKTKLIDKDYLFVILNSDFVRNQALSMAKNSVQPDLTHSMFKSMKIPFYDIVTQRKIAKTILSIQDQIEKNNDMVNKLQVLSQTIFNKYYGKSMYKFNGILNDLCTLPSGYSFEPIYYVQNGKYKLITIKNVNRIFVDCERVDTLNEIPTKMKEYCKLEKCDILLSLTGNVGRISINSLSNCLLNQRVSKMICDEKYKLYLYLLLNTNYYQSKMNQMASGTSQKNLSPLDVENLNIHIPNNIDEFYSVTKNIFIQLCDINSFSIKLQNMKNKLLPLLINGQLH